MTSTLFARSEHGGHKVLPLPAGFQVEWPVIGVRTYPSARQTIMALVNRTPDPASDAYDPRWSFDRYFRQGRYNREPQLGFDIFDLFRPDPPNQVVIAVRPSVVVPDPTLTVHVPNRGIDLEKRGHEVRKLFYAGFARQVIRKGYDPEDVLQEVFKGILVRNLGKCPFDAAKSSFGHYVHMVCGCIISNYYRRYNRLNMNEQFGVGTFEGEVDVAEADLESVEADQEDQANTNSVKRTLMVKLGRREGLDFSLVSKCFDLLVEGLRYKDIAARLDRDALEIQNVVKQIRKVAGTVGY